MSVRGYQWGGHVTVVGVLTRTNCRTARHHVVVNFHQGESVRYEVAQHLPGRAPNATCMGFVESLSVARMLESITNEPHHLQLHKQCYSFSIAYSKLYMVLHFPEWVAHWRSWGHMRSSDVPQARHSLKKRMM